MSDQSDSQHHIVDLDADGETWAVRKEGEPRPDGSWAELTLDLGDPHTQITTPESFVDDHPAPRKVEVIDGGLDELLHMLWAADKLRARLLRRDLRWINGVATAAGFRIALVRDAREDD
jgi:hypothetical protein